MSRKKNKAISEASQDKFSFGKILKENHILDKKNTLPFSSEYILLYDRSVKIWKDWKSGKLSDIQYEILMNTTLKEIRMVIRNEQKAGKEEAKEGSN